MSTAMAARKAWIVAASIGAVEALKDQGVCRWNYPLRSLHNHVKNDMKTYYQTKILPSSARFSSSSVVGKKMREERIKRTEKSMKTVMDLSCWGPNTVRF